MHFPFLSLSSASSVVRKLGLGSAPTSRARSRCVLRLGWIASPSEFPSPPTRASAAEPRRSGLGGPSVAGFQTGSGQTCVFVYERATNPLRFAICCFSAHMLPQITIHVVTSCHISPPSPMKIEHGALRHFCDDPVCPDPASRAPLAPPSDRRRSH